MKIEKLFAYSENCRHLLRETLLANPETFDKLYGTTSPFSSIHQLVAHIMGAEERWCKAGLLQPDGSPWEQVVPVRYEERAADSIAGIFADWDTIRADTLAYVNGLSTDDLDIVRHFTRRGIAIVMTVEDTLFHIVNHENYHRGQIITELQRQGIDPPDFDYPRLKPQQTVSANHEISH